MLGVFFLAVLYLQRVLGYDAVRTGAAFLPISLVDRRALARLLRAPERPLRPAHRAAARRCASIAAGLAAALARAGRRPLRRPTSCPAMLLLGIGGGLDLPGPDDARDVRRRAGGLGPRLRPRQHHPAGRRRARPRDPRDRRREPHGRRDRPPPRWSTATSAGVRRRRGASCSPRWSSRVVVLRPARGATSGAEAAEPAVATG